VSIHVWSVEKLRSSVASHGSLSPAEQAFEPAMILFKCRPILDSKPFDSRLI
jgi:hypothetical protein